MNRLVSLSLHHTDYIPPIIFSSMKYRKCIVMHSSSESEYAGCSSLRLRRFFSVVAKSGLSCHYHTVTIIHYNSNKLYDKSNICSNFFISPPIINYSISHIIIILQSYFKFKISLHIHHCNHINHPLAISYAVQEIATLGACNATRGNAPRNNPRGPSSCRIDWNASMGVV